MDYVQITSLINPLQTFSLAIERVLWLSITKNTNQDYYDNNSLFLPLLDLLRLVENNLYIVD